MYVCMYRSIGKYAIECIKILIFKYVQNKSIKIINKKSINCYF